MLPPVMIYKSLEMRVLHVVGFRIRPMRPTSNLMIEGLHDGMIYDKLRPTNGRTAGRTNGPADGRTESPAYIDARCGDASKNYTS